MNVLINGQVGPQALSDGASQAFRQGRSAELIVGELHGRFYEQALRGSVFSAGMSTTSISNATFTQATAASATLATAATATPILGLWNPLSNNVNVVLLQANLTPVLTALQATGPGNLIWLAWTGQNAITTGNAPWNRKTLLQSGSSVKNLAGLALTGLSTVQGSTSIVLGASSLGAGAAYNASLLATAAGFMTQQQSQVENIDGGLIIPPGGLIGLFATTTPVAHSAAGSLLWEEVPV
jgi:hypothetical protein